jgi:predicted alpha-1,2-mannosidase
MKPLFLALVLCPWLLRAAEAPDLTQHVNVFSGTDGTGHTFPGPCLPFGLVQPGPDNRDTGWDYTSGYQFKDTRLLGFSQTRLSGTGIPELGDVLLLPSAGAANPRTEATMRKTAEQAAPGYYTVELDDGVKVELTCTERVALHRYTFPGEAATVLVDLQHGLRFQSGPLVLASEVQVENQTTLSGWCATENWVKRKYFFTVRFDRAADGIVKLPARPGDQAPRYALSFRLGPDRSLQAKVALSSVGVDGANANLQAEQPGWEFAAVRAAARKKWNDVLHRVEIEADETTRRVFYTCLYRLFIHPTNLADVDGRYRGADDRIHHADGGVYYTTLSTWDVYRAAFPLLMILAPERIDGLVRSLLAHHEAQGYLPIWTAWGQENHCMIGNHSIAIIAAAHVRGFRGFDAGAALNAMIQTSTVSHLNSDWELLNRHGYYPFDQVPIESVSRTLESAFDDHCIATMARTLGRPEVAATFARRADYYRNLFDPGTKLMRGRDSAGHWRNPFDPLTATSPLNNPGDYTEANAWQYTWTPGQHDVAGLMELMGGRAGFTRQLDEFFTLKAHNPDKHLGQEAMIGQYPHGNEPCHHVPWLYAFSDQPGRVAELTRQICRDFYRDSPDGLIGNDDCGQMSAWYVFATLGFYPLDPSSGDYVLGAPLVAQAKINLPGGRSFFVRRGPAPAAFGGGAVLNGHEHLPLFLPHAAIARGGELTFP